MHDSPKNPASFSGECYLEIKIQTSDEFISTRVSLLPLGLIRVIKYTHTYNFIFIYYINLIYI